MASFRRGRTLMPEMITSNSPATRAGMSPSQGVGTNSIPTPMSPATFFATSISNPTSSPFLFRIAQGTKIDMPALSTPRFLIVSTTLPDTGCFGSSCAAAPAATATTSAAAMTSFHTAPVHLTALSLLPWRRNWEKYEYVRARHYLGQ